MARYRATDGPRKGKLWVFLRRLYLIWVAAVPAIAVIAALVAVLEVQDQVDEIAKTQAELVEVQKQQAAESRERVNETCTAFERDAIIATRFYRDARRAYGTTIKYLDNLPPDEASTLLNRTVKEGLPRLRREVRQRYEEAKATAAPPFCDEPQVGLPEPDPFLPERAFP